MKINKKALRLIDKGLSANTVSKLNESQIDVLYNKLNLSEAITQSTTTSFNIPTTDADKGVTLPSTIVQPGKKLTVQKTPTGIKVTPTEGELGEEEEVTLDPNKDVETQDAHQVGPSSDDGFGDETDGMGMFENEQKPNPWAICHSQVGPKKSRKWERCVKAVKKQLGEGKNPVSLFLETQIMKIVEKNIPPRITKGDLVKYLAEQGPATAPSKPKTSPGTKPGKPATRPQKPGHPLKNPNPGEKPAPKAKKITPEVTKDKVIDVIMKLLKNG
jgi:hypothetical protein